MKLSLLVFAAGSAGLLVPRAIDSVSTPPRRDVRRCDTPSVGSVDSVSLTCHERSLSSSDSGSARSVSTTGSRTSHNRPAPKASGVVTRSRAKASDVARGNTKASDTARSKATTSSTAGVTSKLNTTGGGARSKPDATGGGARSKPDTTGDARSKTKSPDTHSGSRESSPDKKRQRKGDSSLGRLTPEQLEEVRLRDRKKGSI